MGEGQNEGTPPKGGARLGTLISDTLGFDSNDIAARVPFHSQR